MSTAPSVKARVKVPTVADGKAPASRARVPLTCGAANEVPLTVVYSGRPPNDRSLLVTLVPGATTFGNTEPSQPEGPRLLAALTARFASTAPAENAEGLAAGLAALLGAGPSLPAANTTAMPA